MVGTKESVRIPDGFIEITNLEEYESEEFDIEEGYDMVVANQERSVKLVSGFDTIDMLSVSRGVVDGEPGFIHHHYQLAVVVRREVDIMPEFPTELASAFDWLTRIDDNGYKVALQTIHRTFGGDVTVISDTGMGVDHVPSAAPSDRYVGQQWRCAPIVEWHTPVCGVCHIQTSINGTCFC